MFKFNKEDPKMTSWRHFDVFAVNFEQSHTFFSDSIVDF